MPVQDFKTKEPLWKKKFCFFVILKSWENADTAFCIVTDDKSFYNTVLCFLLLPIYWYALSFEDYHQKYSATFKIPIKLSVFLPIFIKL